MRFFPLLLLFPLFLYSCGIRSKIPESYSDPVMPLIKLPMDFKSYRQNSNVGNIEAGGYYDILDVEGPGCVRSFWFIRAANKNIEITTDNAETPQINMPLESFMGILLGKEPYIINSAAFVSLPNEGMKKEGSGMPRYTCYLPIPFQESCRIRIHVNEESGMAAMVNWHKYNESTFITSYRLHATNNIKKPAPARGGTMLMADISGEGFVAGIFQGIVQKDNSDVHMKVNNVIPEHTWVNLHYLYCTPAWTPFALTEKSVYAKTILKSNIKKSATIRIGFDDWITLWLNGKKLSTFYHDEDFNSEEIPVKLDKGNNELLVKYANFDKLPNNRLWAFSLLVK
ncbi:DUF2961 domain-containing protein [Bacteroidota bacterium]